MKKIFFVIFFVIIFEFIRSKVITTEYGKIRGENQADKPYFAFRGVPFIKPPVKNLRFADPEPVTPWKDILDTIHYKPQCPQECNLPREACSKETAEDCVYLNVFTPKNFSQNDLLPVMVYFAGGAYSAGGPGPGLVLYEGGTLAAKGNIVVVTVGYRLGALGYLFDPSRGIFGNYGFKDQRKGILWVRRNIHKFGGDADNISLAGQSAGGHSVAAHMTSPKSKGLFHKAIMESKPVSLVSRTRESAQITGRFVSTVLNCENLECLREKSIEEILKAQKEAGNNISQIRKPLIGMMPWGPVLDHEELPDRFLVALEKGNYQPMPVLMGNVEHEGETFITNRYRFLSSPEYTATLTAFFRTGLPRVLYMYPPYVFSDNRPVFSQLISDYLFIAPSRFTFLKMKKLHPRQPLWYFHWNRSTTRDMWGPGWEFCVPYSCHSVNIPYVFQSYGGFTKEEIELSNQVIQYYSNFMHTGNPNVRDGKLLKWPEYENVDSEYLNFETPLRNSIDPRKEYHDFWNEFGFHHGIGPLEIKKWQEKLGLTPREAYITKNDYIPHLK